MKKGKSRTRLARRDIIRSNAKIAARRGRQYDHHQYDGRDEGMAQEA